jgi:Rrf2 family protein
MLNLAQHYKDGNHAIILKNVADEEEISIRYLEQIVIPLKISKLVKSIRGAGGGYTLARNPSDIKLIEILDSLEGTCSLVDCVEDETYCDRYPLCATFEIWKEASNLLKEHFEKTTLEDLIKISKKKSSKNKASA